MCTKDRSGYDSFREEERKSRGRQPLPAQEYGADRFISNPPGFCVGVFEGVFFFFFFNKKFYFITINRNFTQDSNFKGVPKLSLVYQQGDL